MTREQIANLVARTDEGCFDGEGINVTKEDVLRLLQERQRLLDGCKQSLLQLEGPEPLNRDEWITFLHEVVDEVEPPAPAPVTITRTWETGLTVSAEDFKAAAAGISPPRDTITIVMPTGQRCPECGEQARYLQPWVTLPSDTNRVAGMLCRCAAGHEWRVGAEIVND